MSERLLMEIVDSWGSEKKHIPGCQFSDLDYCLECHTLAFNALAEYKRRHPE